jgi:uncharacterized OB-fold protein
MQPRFDLPTIEDETAPWWQATKEGRLLIRRCADCGRAHFYPRPFCPSCWSERVEWEQASGDATLYTFSIVRSNDLPPFGPRVPYVAAVVDLIEGPRMMTNLENCPLEDIRIGMALKVSFRIETDDVVLPVFTPILQGA